MYNTCIRVAPSDNFKVIIAFAMIWPLASTSDATVIEFDPGGKATVSEHSPVDQSTTSPKPSPSNAQIQELRELTRTVAVRFSGEPGVRKAGLDALTFVEVFEALIAAESGFDPKAVSPRGAQGLGQLMPDTATDLKVDDPFDPHQNLIGSARYLTGLMSNFGSLELALAAYNAGPDRVKEHKGVPPFAETKAYIAKIFKQSGIETPADQPAAAQPVSVPINKEQPLQGEISVWEF